MVEMTTLPDALLDGTTLLAGPGYHDRPWR